MNYKVKVYSQTYFSPGSLRPFNLAALNRFTGARSYESNFYLVQNDGLSKVRVRDNYSNIQNADFCIITPQSDESSANTTAYFISNIQMLNNDTCELTLITDCWLTAMIRGVNYLDLMLTRMPDTDGTICNTLEEPGFRPSDPEVVQNYTSFFSDAITDTVEMLGSTVALNRVSKIASAYKDGDGETVIYVPQAPAVSVSTEFRNPLPSSQFGSTRTPGVLFYDLNSLSNETRQGLEDTTSLGLIESFKSRYTLPSQYVGNVSSGVGGQVNVITGIRQVHTANLDNRTTRHKKTKWLYQMVNYGSTTSGSLNQLPAASMVNNYNDTVVKFNFISDVSETGKPYMIPVYLSQGMVNLGDNLINAVSGCEWYKPGFSQTGAPGSAILQNNYKRDYATRGLSNAISQVGNVGTSAFGLLGALTGLVTLNPNTFESGLGTSLSSAANAVNADTMWQQENRNKLQDLITSTNLYQPIVSMPQNSMPMTSNGFFCMTKNLSSADLDALDNYFDKFGVAVPPTPADLNGITGSAEQELYYQGNVVSIQGNFPLYMKQSIENMFSNGVRFLY